MDWRDDYSLPFKERPLNKAYRIWWVRWLGKLIDEAREEA
jgi:hypothetical protein